MKLGMDELREAAGETQATEEAAAEAMEVADGSAPATRVPHDSAIREFTEFKKAERELKEVLIEEEKNDTSWAEALREFAEALSDPQIRGMITQAWYGADSVENQAENIQQNMSENTDQNVATPPEENAVADGGDTAEGEDIYEITPEAFYEILMENLRQLKALNPDMTIEEAEGHAEKNKGRIIKRVGELLEELDS